MSSDLSGDLRSRYQDLEQQATSMMKAEDYENAERTFQEALKVVNKLQQNEKRRIHKGPLFCNIGLSQILQRAPLMDALRNLLLAYIEDCLNSENGSEDTADTMNAARVLKKGFAVNDQNLNKIKDAVRVKKRAEEVVLDPEDLLNDFLRSINVAEDNLFALCARKPELDKDSGLIYRQYFSIRSFK